MTALLERLRASIARSDKVILDAEILRMKANSARLVAMRLRQQSVKIRSAKEKERDAER